MINALFTVLINFSGLQLPTFPDIEQSSEQATGTQTAQNRTAKCSATIPEKTVNRMIFTYGLYNSSALNALGLMPILLTPFYSKLFPKAASLWLFAATSLFWGRSAAYFSQPKLPADIEKWQKSYDLFYKLPQLDSFKGKPALSPEARHNIIKLTPPQWHELRNTIRSKLTTRQGKALYYGGVFTPWLLTLLSYKLGAFTLVAFPGIASVLQDIRSLVADRSVRSLNIPLGALEKLDEDLAHQPLVTRSHPTPFAIAKASPSTDDFSLVPPDVYNVIFRYLDGPDLLRAQLVSRTWYHALQSYLQNQLYSNDHFYKSKGLFFANLALTPRTDLDTKRVLSISAPAINAHAKKANKSALKMMRAPLSVPSSVDILDQFLSNLTNTPNNIRYFTPEISYIGLWNGQRNDQRAPFAQIGDIYFNQPEILQKLSNQRLAPPLLNVLLKNIKVLDLTSFVPSQDHQPIVPFINICTYFAQPNFTLDELHLDIRLMACPAYRDVLSKLSSNLNNTPRLKKLILKMAPNVYTNRFFHLISPLHLKPFPHITLDFTSLDLVFAPLSIEYRIFNDWLYDFPHDHITLKVGQSFWRPQVLQTDNLLRDRRNLSDPLQHLKSASFIVPQDHYADYRKTFQDMRLPEPFTVQLSTLEAPNAIETIEIPKTN